MTLAGNVGYTPQTADICVCRRHAEKCRPGLSMSAVFLAVWVVSMNFVSDTLS